jgi:hypothetical protein
MSELYRPLPSDALCEVVTSRRVCRRTLDLLPSASRIHFKFKESCYSCRNSPDRTGLLRRAKMLIRTVDVGTLFSHALCRPSSQSTIAEQLASFGEVFRVCNPFADRSRFSDNPVDREPNIVARVHAQARLSLSSRSSLDGLPREDLEWVAHHLLTVIYDWKASSSSPT